MNRLDPLDALRVLALLVVFANHVNTGIAGGVGVIMFFTLSGYQIGRGFLSGRYTAKDYLRKRLLVVGLPYMAFVTIYIIVSGYSDPGEILQLFTFTLGYTGSPLWHLWFISVLMQLYIIALVFGLAIQRIKDNVLACRLLFIAVLIVGYSLRTYCIGHGLPQYHYIQGYVDVFFGAFMLSWLRLKPLRSRTLQAIAVIALLVCIFTSRQGVFYTIEGTLAASLLFIYVFDTNVRKGNDKLSWQAVRSNPLRLIECLSVVSFAFYIWHAPVIHYVYWTLPGALFVPASFAISCILAAIWHCSVEQWAKKTL